ncbi:flavin reductase family protein [Nocardia asteroides]|uniref:flavin reductase family protein n=1 Tax=Nocardia asteroides TaxID=1824 RepID=UPI001E57CE5A|nr:flavin reductase family protein [Nocardia asteroides]UGT61938.1 flavin reductase family protein [Nocardia asteroides]
MSENTHDAESDCTAVLAAADYPVFVVTTRAGAERSGCLVGFTAQVSIDPLRFLVGISKSNHTFGVAERAERLVVQLLPHDRRALAELFGAETGDEIDKFERCAWRPGPGGLPILTDAAGWFSGPILERHDYGDHVGMLLAPDVGSAPASGVAVVRMADVEHLEPGHRA